MKIELDLRNFYSSGTLTPTICKFTSLFSQLPFNMWNIPTVIVNMTGLISDKREETMVLNSDMVLLIPSLKRWENEVTNYLFCRS